MIKIYGIKNCDTIKKTLKWFDAHNLDYQFIDYKKQPPDADLARQFVTEFGWETVINKRGTTWRKLDQDTKDSITDDSAVALMIEQPSIIKRPIIEQSGKRWLGYDETQLEQLI